MATNFVQPGDVVELIAPANLSSGQGFIQNTLFGVAQTDATAGQPVPAAISGVHELPKDTALVINQGDRVYWDNANGWVDKTATGQVCVGQALEFKLAADTTVKVVLRGSTAAGA